MTIEGLTVSEVAERTNLKPATIYELINAGVLEYNLVGRNKLITTQSFIKWNNNRKGKDENKN